MSVSVRDIALDFADDVLAAVSDVSGVALLATLLAFRAAGRARDRVVPVLIDSTCAALGSLPRNDALWAYAILGADGSRYVDRVLFPRVAGRRIVLHRIHRADRDPWMHNHPWRTASFLILSGGYVEERPAAGGRQTRRLHPGDVNCLDDGEFHRIVHVEPGTCTVGWLGERCRDWGFLVDDRELVLATKYFARIGYADSGVHS